MKYIPELRAMVAQKYLDGVASAHVLASEYNISKFAVRVWAQKYQEHGISAFIRGRAIHGTHLILNKCVLSYISPLNSRTLLSPKYCTNVSSFIQYPKLLFVNVSVPINCPKSFTFLTSFH